MIEWPFMLPFPIQKILFICTANRSRSIFAAALVESLQSSYQLSLNVFAAGTDAQPDLPPTENTHKILKNRGISTEGLRSKVCTEEMIKKADVIFVMEKYHRDHILAKYPEFQKKVFYLADFCTETEPWIKEMGIPDPVGMNFIFYENVFHLIENSCKNILHQIKAAAPLQ